MVRWCAVIFQLYDTDGDGYVTGDNMLSLLRMTAGKALSENQLQQVRPPELAPYCSCMIS